MGFKPRAHTKFAPGKQPVPGYDNAQPPKKVAALLKIDSFGLLEPDEDGSYSTAIAAIESGAFDKVINSWSPGKRSRSLLQLAIYSKDMKLVEVCLAHHADPERCYVARHANARRRDEPPLVSAATNPKLLRLLLQYGAQVDGHLPSIGRTALFMAGSPGNRECIEMLLEAGADPLFGLGTGATTPLAMSKAKLRSREPKTIALLEEAVRNRGTSTAPLFQTRKAGKVRFDRSKSRGVAAFTLSQLEHESAWGVTLVKAPLEKVSNAVQRRYQGSRRLARPTSAIPDTKARVIFCVGFRGMPWTVCYEVVEEHLYTGQFELASARNISKQLQCEAIAFGCWHAAQFANGVKAEQQLWEPETIAERGNIALDSSRAFDRFEAQQLQAMNSWFVAHDVLVPPMSYLRDGVTISARFEGISKDAVEGIDVVVLPAK